ncbi:hypothetical protein MPSEU_000535600 [Mayamaea pseudoterrestris]|nr:hypothetical protein MPSEU_000535600 [Mayamaea pseudoterrestris]
MLHPTHTFDRDEEGLPPKRPRRLWAVSDTQLPKLPFMYPPLCHQTSRCIKNTPASVVAIRIAECLRLRSVAVEYDEESASASCMTIDRCHFQVQLWRAPSIKTSAMTSSSNNNKKEKRNASLSYPNTTLPSGNSGSDGLIVDCLRVRGPLLTFHRTVHALLEAAESLDSGAMNTSAPNASSALEFVRLTNKKSSNRILSSSQTCSPPPSPLHQSQQYAEALDALEHVLSMLRKDRLEAQELGMEYLVSLTDTTATCTDTAVHCALAVSGAPGASTLQQSPTFLRELHKDWIMSLLVKRTMPGEQVAETEVLVDADAAAPVRGIAALKCASSLFGDGSPKRSSTESLRVAATPTMATIDACGDEHHGSKMRSMALRAFTNSLELLESQALLPRILVSPSSALVSPSLLKALMDDAHGAMRHASVAVGTRLASQHEAVLAIRCLRILATNSQEAERLIVTEQTMELLDKARSVGESNHLVLAEEANRTYLQLTEDFRSC